MEIKEFILRLLFAMAAGMAIGFERQWHNKAAGLRTNMLVAVGSALYVLLSMRVIEDGSGDITRVIGQVVVGIGFIGAGIIFKESINVKGLTTAATIWCSSAVGCLAAAGYYPETITGALAVISVNSLFIPMDRWLKRRTKRKQRKRSKTPGAKNVSTKG